MKDTMKKDKIELIDFDSAFPETPSVIHRAVMKAHDDIIRYERRKRFIKNAMTAVAACLLVIAGAAVFFTRSGGDGSDLIMPPVLSQADIHVDMETPVFASRTGPYYHRDPACASAGRDCVELPLITAVEFEKTACPACASDLIIGTDSEDAANNTENLAAEVVDNTGSDRKKLLPAVYSSEGAADLLLTLKNEGTDPVYRAEFFGGSLAVYKANASEYIGHTDPSPGEETFRYILIGHEEISADEYYKMNNGPGKYAEYDSQSRMRTDPWGETYDRHYYYTYAVEMDIINSETGECTWRMNMEQYERFIDDSVLTVTQNVDDWQPNLSAMLDAI